jgi:hypothetical protein
MKELLKHLIFTAVLTTTPDASANYLCTGQVNYLGIDSGGDVVVSLASGPYHKMCSIVNQGEYGIVPTVCKTIYATLLAAKPSGRQVSIYYTDNEYT